MAEETREMRIPQCICRVLIMLHTKSLRGLRVWSVRFQNHGQRFASSLSHYILLHINSHSLPAITNVNTLKQRKSLFFFVDGTVRLSNSFRNIFAIWTSVYSHAAGINIMLMAFTCEKWRQVQKDVQHCTVKRLLQRCGFNLMCVIKRLLVPRCWFMLNEEQRGAEVWRSLWIFLLNQSCNSGTLIFN